MRLTKTSLKPTVASFQWLRKQLATQTLGSLFLFKDAVCPKATLKTWGKRGKIAQEEQSS